MIFDKFWSLEEARNYSTEEIFQKLSITVIEGEGYIESLIFFRHYELILTK
jgi:hypothetical protein